MVHATILYEAINYNYVRPKADKSQLNLPHGTKQKSKEETKNKNQDAQKKRSSHEVRGVSPRPEGCLWWERFAK